MIKIIAVLLTSAATILADVRTDVKTEQVLRSSDLYRHARQGISLARFHADLFSSMFNVTNIAIVLVKDDMDCAFKCVGEPKCLSYNMAVNPDSNGLHLCELLATEKYRATDKLHANATFHYYSPWLPCGERNPCGENADCFPLYNISSYYCVCREPFLEPDCQELLAKSCSDIKSHIPSAQDGDYMIDPDWHGGVTPFSVFCDMTASDAIGVTVVSHDSGGRTLVNGYEERGSYSKDIQYTGASFAQLAVLTEVSERCNQYLKYDCRGSSLTNWGWWVSRNHTRMNYWAGAEPGSGKCACGMDGTCVVPAKKCNCDENSSANWRKDAGHLNDKSTLPVSQLRFGDTGASSEKGYHTLGPFKCSGTV